MQRTMLKSKIHRATITEADLNYDGSLTIDQDLLDAAGIVPFERVKVYNINNGERFDTYAIQGERGSGVIGLNGAAARKGHTGDLIIIVTYAQYDESELGDFAPTIILCDEKNGIRKLIDK
ncbi:MAG: aspartate 1-decarboxylase [Candidatus Electrothrix sp. GW3-4]|uniref:aspartate 1-decarboxylase n=1 Tax=Candidatus Electrothrix sp. GW3-4 TaxID=3126740 RepID=UPI0030CAACD5